MLSRTHRFHGHSSLSFAFKQGSVVRGPLVSLRYALNPRRKSYRVAVVVSRKVSKSAVVRNRIRRRVYAAVREQAVRITEPYDLVFSCFSEDLATIEIAKLQQLVAESLQKAGVTKPINGAGRAIVNAEGGTR